MQDIDQKTRDNLLVFIHQPCWRMCVCVCSPSPLFARRRSVLPAAPLRPGSSPHGLVGFSSVIIANEPHAPSSPVVVLDGGGGAAIASCGDACACVDLLEVLCVHGDLIGGLKRTDGETEQQETNKQTNAVTAVQYFIFFFYEIMSCSGTSVSIVFTG